MKKTFVLALCLAVVLCGCTTIPNVPSSTAPSSISSLPESSSAENGQESSSSKEVESFGEEPSSAEGSGDEFYDKGVALLETEKIGGLYISMPEGDVIELLGEPTTKGKPEEWGADGAMHWDASYSKIGLEINYIKEHSGESKIFLFSIDSKNFNGETLRGIRIGSKKQEVLDAYAQEINPEDSGEKFIVAGSIYWGIIFGLSDQNEVTSIFFGAGAE